MTPSKNIAKPKVADVIVSALRGPILSHLLPKNGRESDAPMEQNM
jgi:hypothetical protein